MQLKMYHMTDDDNVINKNMILKYPINIKIKSSIDIVNPIIILNDKGQYNFNEVNYCYIDDFIRYYFIRSVENKSNHLWQLNLECDVLESFKDDILNSYAQYTRSVQKGDYVEFNAITDVRKEIDIYDSDVTLESKKNIILTTMGGV